MRTELLARIALSITALCGLLHAEARVWRVNNTPGVNAQFNSLSSAINNNGVQDGDTLYIEGSSTAYSSSDLNKRLVLIGPGYLLSGPGGNPGLQFNTLPATLSGLTIDSLASGSTIMGMSGNLFIRSGTDNLVITRNDIAIYNSTGGVKSSNHKITHNFIRVASAIPFENLEFTNNILNGACIMNHPNNSNILFRNNVSSGNTVSISNAYISNNIFNGSLNEVNCTVKYNIATGTNTLPAGNNNQNGRSMASIVVNTGSDDGKFRLAAGSPAIGAGEPINGVTPDCGPFGTDDPYRLSGIPPIPTIYALTVPASVPSTSGSMTITISTRSNN